MSAPLRGSSGANREEKFVSGDVITVWAIVDKEAAEGLGRELVMMRRLGFPNL